MKVEGREMKERWVKSDYKERGREREREIEKGRKIFSFLNV